MDGLAERKEEAEYQSNRFYKYVYIFLEPLSQCALSINKAMPNWFHQEGLSLCLRKWTTGRKLHGRYIELIDFSIIHVFTGNRVCNKINN